MDLYRFWNWLAENISFISFWKPYTLDFSVLVDSSERLLIHFSRVRKIEIKNWIMTEKFYSLNISVILIESIHRCHQTSCASCEEKKMEKPFNLFQNNNFGLFLFSKWTDDDKYIYYFFFLFSLTNQSKFNE